MAMGRTTTITTDIRTTMTTEPPKPVDETAPTFEFWRSARWWRAWAVAGFGPMFWAFSALAAASGALVWWLKGPEVFWQSLDEDFDVLVETLPRVMAAVGIAGILWVLLPRERLSAWVGQSSGILGLVMAAVAGAITPGGPTAAFSLLAMFGAMGADRGMMIAYVSSWATLGLQRILVWDIQMMGPDFSLLRFVATLPLPILAGMLARALPITLTLKEERRLRDRL